MATVAKRLGRPLIRRRLGRLSTFTRTFAITPVEGHAQEVRRLIEKRAAQKRASATHGAPQEDGAEIAGAADYGRRHGGKKTASDIIARAAQTLEREKEAREESEKDRKARPHTIEKLEKLLRARKGKKLEYWIHMLKTLQKEKLYTSALRCFKELKKEALPGASGIFAGQAEIKAETYTQMLRLHARLGQVKETYALYEEIQEAPEMDLEAAHSKYVLLSLAKAGEHETMMEVVNVLPPEHFTVELCEVLFNRFHRLGDVVGMEEVMERMATEGLEPPFHFLGSMVDQAAHSGDMQTAQKYYSELREQGKTPSLQNHTSIFHALKKRKDYPSMIGLFDQMNSYEPPMKCSALICNLVLQAHVEMGSISMVDQVLADMAARGIKSNLVTFNTCISAYCKASLKGEVATKTVLEFLDKIEDYTPKAADAVTFSIVIDWCGKQGELDRMEEFFENMLAEGVKPTIHTMNSVIDAYRRKGNMESEMLAALERMKQWELTPSHVIYTTLIKHYADVGDTAGVLKYYAAAMDLEQATEGDSGIHDMMMRGSRNAQEVDTCTAVYEAMKDGTLSAPQIFTFDLLMRMCREQNLEAFAVQLMKDMATFRVKPDDKLTTKFVLLMAQVDRCVDAARFMKLLAPPLETKLAIKIVVAFGNSKTLDPQLIAECQGLLSPLEAHSEVHLVDPLESSVQNLLSTVTASKS